MLRITILALLIGVAGYLAVDKFGSPIPIEPKDGWERKASLETPWRMSQVASKQNALSDWPPVCGKPFPKFDLFDHADNRFSFDSLRGKPTVVEFISMTCAGCQAFSGGNEFGPYGGLASQQNLESFETYFRQYTGHDLYSGEVNCVVVIVYNDKLQSPTAQDLNAWRKHFHMEDHGNVHIVSSPELANGDSFKMIPGFMLLDQEQAVVFDSTGHNPKHNLYTDLLPGVKALLPSRPREQRNKFF